MANNELTKQDQFWVRVVATYLGGCTALLVTLLLFLWPSESETADGSRILADTSIVVQGAYNADSTLELVIVTQPDGERVAFDNAADRSKARLDTTLVLVATPKDTISGVLLIGLILIVGALGSCLHALNSLGVFVGNKSFESNWVLWYFLRPVTGALLAVIFLFVIKGGFDLQVRHDNIYGIVAIAGLVGLFSRQAIDKLADLAETLFQTNKVYEDRLAAEIPPAPVIEAFDPPALDANAPTLTFTVTGSHFVDTSIVHINDEDRETAFVNDTQLRVTLHAMDVTKERTLQVKVINPDKNGGASAPKAYEVKAEGDTIVDDTIVDDEDITDLDDAVG